MLKNKIVAIGLAGVLGMSMGLVGCGNNASNNQAASSEKTETTTEATTQEDSLYLYWEGTLADGQTVAYMTNEQGQEGILAVIKPDLSDGKAWSGKLAINGDKFSITDALTGETINYTVAGANDSSKLTSLNVNIEGYGQVELKPIEASEFTKLVNNVVKDAEAAVKEAGEAIANIVAYWQGTLDDGQLVAYTADEKAQTAVLGIGKVDGEGKTWSGKVSTTGGKTTITDDTTKETISFTGASAASDASDATSLDLNIDGYGAVTLKPVTAQEFVAQMGDAITQTVLYWEGTLPDGRSVAYMDDEEGKNGMLVISNADGSDIKMWTGAVAQNGDKVTITDDESKQTLNITVVSTAADQSSSVLNIEGYGEVELKPVTAGDFGDAIGQAISSL